MDRSRSSASKPPTAMRTAGSVSLDLLLSAAAGERRELASPPQAGPVVPEASLFRQPQNGCRAEGKSQAHPAADAHPGHRSPLSQTELEPSGTGSRSVSLPTARCHNRKTQPRLEHRYYLHSDAERLPVPGRRDGLVQPLRTQLGTFQHHGNWFLSGGARGRVPLRPTRNLDLRSGLAVHLGRVPRSAQAARDLYQYGWPRPRSRQCFHRTAVALTQVRTNLSRRLRLGTRTVSGTGKLFPLLQPSAPSPGARLPNAGGSVSIPTKKEEVILIMEAPPPNPRDLSLFSSRMDTFLFTGTESCRTIEMLDRRIGQRRDATRAPIQARNGRRPQGRLLDQPAAPSKDSQNFVQTMGSTSKLEIGELDKL